MGLVKLDPMIFLWAIIGAVVPFLITYPICLLTKDNSLVDIGWAMSFVSIAWVSFLVNGITNGSWSIRQIIITSLVTVWGFRLLFYIIIRKVIRGSMEDKRFVRYREAWQKNFALKTFLFIFIPQMIIVYIIASPVTFANSIVESTLGILDFVLIGIGCFIWFVGFFFETVGDIQLLRFRKNPANKGKTLNTGLWKYSRHPNYFGETTQWWGIFIIVISLGFKYSALGLGPTIIVWVTILGPILLTLLLLKFSGVGLLEEKVLKDREGYEEYVATTSAFIPWFPKKSQGDK